MRGSQAILYVYNGEGREIYTVELERLRTKENMHAVLQEFFERKSPEELQAEENQGERSRQHRNYKKFHREEYLRKQHLHAQWFRREIMQQEDMTWAGKDWLCRNYDKINRGFAVTKEELLLFAQQYLLKKNHSAVHK